MSQHYQRAKEIFLMVCDLAAVHRGPIIDKECSGNLQLREEVHSLLAHHDAANQPEKPKRIEDAETAPRGSTPGKSESFAVGTGTSQQAPERIGRYRILRRLGVGGMGIVYMAARDDDQFKKRVAIKLIKKGMDSEEILRRFEQERQVLSALNHPNIARMIDGGATDDGRPYFVMEYIEGMPINEYCDKNRLRIEERLELFRTLCSALHHAHQNLIVHRDIKPSNVVVTQDGTVKLLDFGISKLLNPDMVAFANEPTATNFRLMTPEYASPEQVRGDPLSTSSDVYSLGVLLYELVTGRRPYRFKTRLQSEIERVICNEDPERPSTAISHAVEPMELESAAAPQPATASSTIEEIAKLREAKPDRLRRRLSGDIDNMIMLAMRKEPRRRYTSAEQFGEDIRRHLDGLPVIAHPATFSYRMSKFVGRNKAGFAAAAVMALLLIGWAVTANIQANIANEQRFLAEQSRDEAQRVQRLTSAILLDLPSELKSTAGSTEAIAQVIQKAEQYLAQFTSITGEAPNERDVALNYIKLGDIQGSLRGGSMGQPDLALQSYDSAHRILAKLAQADPADVELQKPLVACQIKIADVQRTKDRDLAIRTYEEAVRLGESLMAKVPKDPVPRRYVAIALISLGDMLAFQGRSEEAKSAFLRSQRLREDTLRDNPNDARAEREATVGLLRIADLMVKDGNYEQSETYFKSALEIRKRLLDSDPAHKRRNRDLAWAQYFLAQCYRYQKRWDQARQLMMDSERILAQLYDQERTDAQLQRDLGTIAFALGELELILSGPDASEISANAKLNAAMTGRQHYRQAVKHLEPFALNDRSSLENLAAAYRHWATLDRRAKDLAASGEHLARALELYRRVALTDSRFQEHVDEVETAIADLKDSKSDIPQTGSGQ